MAQENINKKNINKGNINKENRTQENISQEIFKAYDIRGIYPTQLNEDITFKIGVAFANLLSKDGVDVKFKRIIIGRDMRLSSSSLFAALSQGITAAGWDVLDIGLASSDGVYFASGHLNLPAVMITASHNPKEYNGFKLCRAGADPISENTGIKEIAQLIKEKKLKTSSTLGKIISQDFLEIFAEKALSFIDIEKLKPLDKSKPLKIVIDAGNGMAGKIIPAVFKDLPIEIVPLYFELDGNFPHHPASPIEPENLKDLQQKVLAEKADLGMAFDGDADRVFFVDEKGEIINSSIINALLSQKILQKYPREKIIYCVPCSWIVRETITNCGGQPIIDRVGHSFIKKTMRETGAVFGCEHSGHYFYRDFYRADSGVITVLIVLEALSKFVSEAIPEAVSESGKKMSVLIEQFKKYLSLPETNFIVEDKAKKMSELEIIYSPLAKKIEKIDGLTMEFADWWFNVRPSNTEPKLRLNLEAKSPSLLKEKEEELGKILNV